MVEILPLGGMNEIGKNMTAIGFGGEYVIVDMGVRLDSILEFEDAELGEMSRRELININAIPDDAVLHGKKVKAIALTHGHLDHVGAIGKLATAYHVPIYGTPFTAEIVKHILKEERVSKLHGDACERVSPGATVNVGKITIEFIPTTHSLLQTCAILVKKRDESVLVASDFKLDETPLLGRKTDRKRLKELGKDGLTAAMVGAVRVDEEGPTPSEGHAKEMLREVMAEASDGNGLVYVTTFSSHIVRLKSIVDLSFELGRTPVLVGRSMKNYCGAALGLGLVNFPKELQILGRPNASRHMLRKIDHSRSDYVMVCTGHQGEPTSVMSRIADGRLTPEVRKGDEVIFSASVIPNPINQSNRAILETKLEAQGAKIYRDIHVSGHAARVDTIQFMNMIRPDNVIPCHGTPEKLEAMADIARKLGYAKEKVHVCDNGASLELSG
jgi:ribonuclease J